MPRLSPLALLLIVSLGFGLAARPASAVPPGQQWRTIESPHFVLHFHDGLYPIALRSIRLLETSHDKLVPFLRNEPRRKTQVVLTDHTDEANGSATAYPRAEIRLYASPPGDTSDLGDHDDYLYILIAHEYAHILHIGTILGLPDLLSRTIGLLVVPNGLQPRFLTEGLATYQESHLSSAGRLRSARYEMMLRADVLDDRMLTLSQLTSGPLRWPRGSAWYLYGSRLLQYLAETRGDEAILRYSHLYGSRLVPYGINLDLEEAAGIDWIGLYDEWKDDLQERTKARIAALEKDGPPLQPTFRTRFGGRTGAPRWGPDGSLYYIEASEHRRPHVRRYDPEAQHDTELRELGSNGTLAPLPDGSGVLVARTEVFRSYWSYGDLFRVDRKRERQLTQGLRASEVDVSPDGALAVFVRRGAGRTWLARIPLEDPREAETIYEPPPEQQVYTPRVAPDGTQVVFSQSRAPRPGRDLWLLDLRDGSARRLTDDDALDQQPSWTPDGNAIVFTSDRSGIFNLHSLSLADGTLLRLTNEHTGAFQPDVSPDGSLIAWTTYSSAGYDVAIAPTSALLALPVTLPASYRPPTPWRENDALYAVRPYDPWETLLPTTWLPYLAADAGGTLVGVSTGASDILDLHSWALSVGMGLQSRQVQAAGSYTYRDAMVQPTLSAATVYRSVPGFASGTTERASTGNLSLSYPWGTTRRSQAVTLGYQGTWMQPVHVPEDTSGPRAGLAAELQLGWGIASYERPPESISPEAGYSLTLQTRLGDPALGGDFSYRSADVRGSAYLRMPWHRHHVLALTGLAGVGQGDLGERRLFSLGGPLLRDPLVDFLYTGRILGEGILRGYEPGAFTGRHLVLGSAEYRFPLVWLDAGHHTLPFWAGKLAGAVFAEAGNAFDRLPPDRVHPSVGGELRLSFELGWFLAGSLRLGHAYGFDRSLGGGHHTYLGVGASF